MSRYRFSFFLIALINCDGISLSEIALSLGYSSQSYFQNQFKAEFGITPIPV
ncbi:MAG: AraC family transcriptional regulator [Clostridia bacterium]|nr:AraC family transcriptional regulator [Clostridia bacterium]